ncbi:MAG: type II toxin-antitoxin system RelE/ParE family toxin [Chthonomonadaceae bacterium]|nr:type II toxin-antitoxin system RelE/ParE family toxin [Chthonomonadaceae bacterium]
MKTYLVDYSEIAEAELDTILLRMIRLSPRTANRWQEGLTSAIEDLSSMPRRFAVAREQPDFNREVRALLYGKYRVLYTILDTDGNGEEDTVRILHIRHGSQDFSLPTEEELDK